jgi:hypothetical protein
MKNILYSTLFGIVAPAAYTTTVSLAFIVTGIPLFNTMARLTTWPAEIYRSKYCLGVDCSGSGRPLYEKDAVWLVTNFIIFSCLGYIFLRWWQKRRTNVRRSQM